MDDETRLRSLLEGEVAGDSETLKRASRDASIFEIPPALVVYPKHLDDLRRLIRYVADERQKGGRLSLTPRAAGTDMSGGPLSSSIVVDLTRHFNRVKKVGADFAITEPGVFYRDFERETLKRGLLLPSYPASRELCTVGGMVANNAGGEKTLVYGKTDRYVRTLRAILADGNEYLFEPLEEKALKDKLQSQTFEGEIYRRMDELVRQNQSLLNRARPKVSKNSAGYCLWNVWDKKTGRFDLSRLLVGSQGTLAIITEISFALVKPKSHSRMLVIFLRDLRPLAAVAGAVLKFKPESFESYDNHTFKFALKFFPQFLQSMGGNLITLAWRFLPEFQKVLCGGIPKMILLAEFSADNPDAALAKAKEAQATLKSFPVGTRVARTAQETEKYWAIRRESFNLLRHHTQGMQAAPFIDDVTVRPEQLSEFLPQLNKILDQYPIIYTIAGHVGDANFHIIPLMNLNDPSSKQTIAEISTRVFELTCRFGGSITAEHNDGLIRSPFLKQMYGEDVYKLFEKTKEIFDPLNIFNPGKKVGSPTLQQALGHLQKP